MSNTPKVPEVALPVAALRAPLKTNAQVKNATPVSWAEQANIRHLCELLEPAISQAIARKARQRRYTP